MKIGQKRWIQAIKGTRTGRNFFREYKNVGKVNPRPFERMPSFQQPDYAPLAIYDPNKATKATNRINMRNMPQARPVVNPYNVTAPQSYRDTDYSTPYPVVTPLTTIDRQNTTYAYPTTTKTRHRLKTYTKKAPPGAQSSKEDTKEETTPRKTC